jgi:ABC-type lipoprotein export system ATPase subunit
MALINLQNITKKFKMGDEIITALNNVSVSIDLGEFTSIVGTSGSGKSTLMNIIGL